MKTLKERNNIELLELVCELHFRVLTYGNNKEQHNAYIEARKELESRLISKDEFGPVDLTNVEPDKVPKSLKYTEPVSEGEINKAIFTYSKYGPPERYQINSVKARAFEAGVKWTRQRQVNPVSEVPKPRPNDYYESQSEGDRINQETGKTWKEQYKYDLNKWLQQRQVNPPKENRDESINSK